MRRQSIRRTVSPSQSQILYMLLFLSCTQCLTSTESTGKGGIARHKAGASGQLGGSTEIGGSDPPCDTLEVAATPPSAIAPAAAPGGDGEGEFVPGKKFVPGNFTPVAEASTFQTKSYKKENLPSPPMMPNTTRTPKENDRTNMSKGTGSDNLPVVGK